VKRALLWLKGAPWWVPLVVLIAVICIAALTAGIDPRNLP
jgi:hypothetical protein